MPRTVFYTALLFIAFFAAISTTAIVHADDAHPFALIRGDNKSIEYVMPLGETLLGGLEPGNEVVYNLHAELAWKKAGLEYEAAPVAVKIMPSDPRSVVIIAGIDWEPYPSFNPVKFYAHLVIYTNGRKYVDKTIAEASIGNGLRIDAVLDLVYRDNGMLYIVLTSGKHTGRLAIDYGGETLKLLAITHSGSAAESWVKPQYNGEPPDDTTTNPYGPPTKTAKGEGEPRKNDDHALVYAAAGIGFLALLALILSRGSNVVVVGSKRGIVQLLGVLMLLAFIAGAAAAWKLSHPSNLVLYAVAGLGLLLVFLLVLASRRPQVIVVEGG